MAVLSHTSMRDAYQVGAFARTLGVMAEQSTELVNPYVTKIKKIKKIKSQYRFLCCRVKHGRTTL